MSQSQDTLLKHSLINFKLTIQIYLVDKLSKTCELSFAVPRCRMEGYAVTLRTTDWLSIFVEGRVQFN